MAEKKKTVEQEDKALAAQSMSMNWVQKVWLHFEEMENQGTGGSHRSQGPVALWMPTVSWLCMLKEAGPWSF